MDILQIWFFLKHPVCVKMRLTEKGIFLQKRDRSNVRFKTHLSNFLSNFFEIISPLSSKALHLFYLSSFIYIYIYLFFLFIFYSARWRKPERSTPLKQRLSNETQREFAAACDFGFRTRRR